MKPRTPCVLGIAPHSGWAAVVVLGGNTPASANELSATLTALGRGLGAPWGADQKSAALLAWLLL